MEIHRYEEHGVALPVKESKPRGPKPKSGKRKRVIEL
jgi:hypothetical protein